MTDPNPTKREFKFASFSFSIINLLFLARFAWLLTQTPWDSRTSLILISATIICLFFTIAGFLNVFRKALNLVYSIPGSILVIFGIFVILKKGVKIILSEVSSQIFTEVGTWYISLFLWLAGFFFIHFIKNLTSTTIQSKENINKKTIYSKILFISFLVILGLIISFWTYTQLINPLPTYAHYDPEYIYMLNSGTPLIDLELYRRLDHPGTLLQLAGTGITIMLSPLSIIDGSYPYQYLTLHPEIFLLCARFIILIVNCAVIYLIYQYFRQPSNWSSVFAGISAMLAYFALHKQAFEFLTIWSPNAFNFAVGTGLLVLLYYLVLKRNIYPRTLLMISVAFGLGATFHVYMITLFVALVATIFFVKIFDGEDFFPSFFNSLQYVIAVLSGYFIGTMIIIPYYVSYFQWIKSIIIHQGTYGSGDLGILSLPLLAQNFQGIVKENFPLFIAIMLVVFISLVLIINNRKQLSKASRIWAMLIGLYLQFTALILIISKHPVDRYLLSVASLLPVLLILIHKLSEVYQVRSKVLFSIVVIALVVLFAQNLIISFQDHNEFIASLENYQSELRNFQEKYARTQDLKREDIKLYWTYGSFSPCYSLRFGNDFSKRLYTDEINQICPSELQYDIFSANSSCVLSSAAEPLAIYKNRTPVLSYPEFNPSAILDGILIAERLI